MTYLIGASLKIGFINNSSCNKKNLIKNECKKMGIEENVRFNYELNDDIYDNEYSTNISYKKNVKQQIKYILFIEARFNQTPLDIEKCSNFIKYIQKQRVTIEHICNELNNKIIYTSNNNDKQIHKEESKELKKNRRHRALTETDLLILENIKKFWIKNKLSKEIIEKNNKNKNEVKKDEVKNKEDDKMNKKNIMSYDEYLEMIK